MANEFDYATLEAIMAPQTQALQQIAMRPQKSFQTTETTQMTTPNALADILATRQGIGVSTKQLNDALKARENLGYTLASALSNITSDDTPGGWLAGAASGFGTGYNARRNLELDRIEKVRKAQMEDLANILAYDKAMGDTQTQRQVQNIGYTEMPYGGGAGAKGTTVISPTPKFDLRPVEMPEKKIGWGELELQTKRIDPDLGVRTPLGIAAKNLSDIINPDSRYAMQANQNAYTATFTVPKITELTKETGGSRGIDTVPEINIKGGPELTSENMDSDTFARAVKDQAWQAADQIIKANPNATITREELANVFINNFNHGIEKKYRIVDFFNDSGSKTTQQPTSKQEYDYSAYGF